LKAFYPYLLISFIHLVAILSGEKLDMVVMITKPLLLPALMSAFFFLTRNDKSVFRKLVLLALLFSWIGDVVLLFQEHHSNFFLIGLVSFLIAHIFYILAFRKTSLSRSTTLLKEKPLLVLLFIAYGAGFFFLIKDGLGTMMVPVIVYMAIILLMGITALNRFRRVGYDSFILVFTGAICFMASDSLLAMNKFYRPFPLSGFFIMLTYIAAQYLIVRGSWRQIASGSATD